MSTTSLVIQFALNPERRVESETSTYVDSSLTFADALAEIFANSPCKRTPSTFSLATVDVYVNRAPSNPFFLIGANERQQEAFAKSLQDPPHTPVPDADLELTVAEVVAKYKIVVFTLYLKTPREETKTKRGKKGRLE